MDNSIHTLANILLKNNITEVIILGHDQIDEDSCISAILLEGALNTVGISAKFKILDSLINPDTKKVLSQLRVNLSTYYGVTSKEDSLILVDHYKTTHPGTVVACIDHHPTTESFDYLFYDNDTSSACCKKIYNYILNSEIPINKHMIEMVVYGLMIDTFAFKSSRGTLADKNWVDEMVTQYHLDKLAVEQVALRLTDLSGNVENIAMCNLKSYVFGGNKVSSTYIQINKTPDQLKNILSYLQEQVTLQALALWVFLLVDVAEFKTIEYRITSNTIHEIVHPKLTSRAQGIMPVIERLFIY